MVEEQGESLTPAETGSKMKRRGDGADTAMKMLMGGALALGVLGLGTVGAIALDQVNGSGGRSGAPSAQGPASAGQSPSGATNGGSDGSGEVPPASPCTATPGDQQGRPGHGGDRDRGGHGGHGRTNKPAPGGAGGGNGGRGSGSSDPVSPPQNPAPATGAAENDVVKVWIVRRGDTLSEISGKVGVSVDRIAKANDVRNVNLIYTGEALVIPTPMNPSVR